MRASSVRPIAHAIVTSGDEPDQDLDTSLDQWVREPSIVRDAGSVPHHAVERPAHPSNHLVAQLDESWRVIDDPLQWVLQRRKGSPREKNTGWQGRSFCRTREALLRCIREYCGEIDTNSLAELEALADRHPDWDHRSDHANLDVPGTDQAQADGQAEPFVSRGLEVCGADDRQPLSGQSALT